MPYEPSDFEPEDQVYVPSLTGEGAVRVPPEPIGALNPMTARGIAAQRMGDFRRGATRFGVAAIPGTMATLGALAGTAGGPPGIAAGLLGGGALGEETRYRAAVALGLEQPRPWQERVVPAVREGLINTAFEVPGALARTTGREMVRKSFGLSPAGVEQSLIMEERVPVGGGPRHRAGSAMAQRIVRESGQTTRGLLAGSGRSFTAAELADEVVAARQAAVSTPLTTREMQRIRRNVLKRLTQIRGERRTYTAARTGPGSFPAEELKDIKQTAQNYARGKFSQEQGGNVNLSANPEMDVDISRAAKSLLEKIKGVRESEGRTEAAVFTRKAAARAEMSPRQNVQVPLHLPRLRHPLLEPRIQMSREEASRVGHLLASPVGRYGPPLALRAAYAALDPFNRQMPAPYVPGDFVPDTTRGR